MLKKKKFRTHVDEEETEHMLENTYEYVNRNMGYDTHHIGYNGLENPWWYHKIYKIQEYENYY